MTPLLYRPTRRQRGLTLVEVGIAAVLMAMLMGGALLFIADYLRGQYAGCSQNGLIAHDGAGPGNVGLASPTSLFVCDTNETMTGGICYNTDSCGGNDSSAFGGYPSRNTLYCPKTSARQGCDTLTAYAYCAQ